MTKITYGRFEEAWSGFDLLLKGIIETHNFKTVCDVGGGANPLLDLEYIVEKRLNYFVLDISETELQKTPSEYRKIQADIASPDFKVQSKFDMVFSKMLAEHIYDAQQFHKNVLTCLADNGIAVHFFPTFYTLPFLLNRMFPERVADALLQLVAPRDKEQFGKFPAYYHWCRGPIKRQIQRLESVGYEVVEYKGFFGHNYYERVPLFREAHKLKTHFLLKHPIPWLTSYAIVVLKKKLLER